MSLHQFLYVWVITDKNVFSYDLPADVFGPGEMKPTRPKKKTIKSINGTKKVEPITGKRTTGSSETDVSCLSILRHRVALYTQQGIKPVGHLSPDTAS